MSFRTGFWRIHSREYTYDKIIKISNDWWLDLHLQDTMMMGADYYQTESEVASLLAEGKVPIGVGQNTKIRYD